MVRQIIIPSGNAFILHLPDNYIGQKVEVIAFTVDNEEKPLLTEDNTHDNRLAQLMKFIRQNSVHLPDDYKFNREELYD